ncbi:aldo/keto reductase [Limosilactobacillus sp.]|jgi:predicted oxidoreductase|uniref:aldo/keto reductase n=1 Tax=Limosilactobacillus sp. TaxID=2773925 RepID=UPI0025BBDB65|nr:aldo/keto reductase [Limosilactobacillus sp.]MCH3921920.1 aldo/keto reductase [Limosilactobacillus sp.]MCH3928691.1 aldo/keto reductase [Limosilactobacillus sp.]
MQTVKIGGTNWVASNVALGIMRMGTLPVPQAVEALQMAHEVGINFIDSADIYGNDPVLGRGSSEIHFGQAFKKSGLSRDDFYIQSKGGLFANSDNKITRYDSSKTHLIQAVDGILQRMGIDYLDSFLIHRPDPLMDPAEVAAAFDELQAAGKVRHFGVSNFNPQQIALLQSATDQRLLVDQVQFSIAHTGMIDFGLHTNMTDARSINHDGGLLEYARRKHMTIQTWSPFQYGTFAGTFINNDKFADLNDLLAKLADKYHASKNAIAVAWILRHPAQMQVLLGTMNTAHIADSAAGSDIRLTKQEWYDIYFAAGNDLP